MKKVISAVLVVVLISGLASAGKGNAWATKAPQAPAVALTITE
jgi:hypothetical protein